MSMLTAPILLGLVTRVSGCAQSDALGAGAGSRAGHGLGVMGVHGPGMMGGQGALSGLQRLDLTAEQRDKLAKLPDELAREHRGVMPAMHAAGRPHHGPSDEQGERQSEVAMAAAHQPLFESSIDARRRVLGILTPQQRDQLGRGLCDR